MDARHEPPECPDVYAAVVAARTAGAALLGIELGECLGGITNLVAARGHALSV